MRKARISSGIVVALCLGVLAAGQSAPVAPADILIMGVEDPDGLAMQAAGDPNRTWDPAAHVVGTWESVTSMSKMYNPVSAKVPERSLSIAARADIVDVNGLIGFDYVATGIQVLDEKARSIYSSKPIASHYCHFYWPLRYVKKMPTPGQWVDELQPYNLTVSVPMDANHPYPLLLSSVEWSMYALVAGEVKTVDVPFRPTTDWLTLAPNLEVKVEEVTAQSAKYSYRLAIRYSQSKVIWSTGSAVALWTQDPTPEVILTKLDVLDPLGKSIQDQGSGSFSSGGGASGSGGLMTGTASGSGNCDICGTATTLRFTLALKPIQQEVRFILKNVPVPIL